MRGSEKACFAMSLKVFIKEGGTEMSSDKMEHKSDCTETNVDNIEHISENDKVTAATELRRQAEEQKQKYKENMKIFLKTGAFAVAAALLIIVISIAWFAYNDSVKGTNGEISARYDGVEIGSRGDKGVHDDLLNKISEDMQYDLPGAKGGWKHDTSIGESINWLLSDTSNMDNYVAGTEKSDGYAVGESFEETGSSKRSDFAIEPGTKGHLDFFVKPSEDGDCSFDFSLDIIPYKVDDSAKTTEKYVQVTSKTNKTDIDLLSGHILYYLKSTQTGEGGNEKTVYTWIKDGKFHIDISDAKAGNEYDYSIYWFWPLNLGTLILNSGDEFLNGNKVEFGDIDSTGNIRKAVVDDMLAAPEKYFYSSLTGKPLNVTYPEVKAIPEIYQKSGTANSYDKQLFVDLSSYYNQADMRIGDTISFIRVSLGYLGRSEVENEEEQ